jgi:hypothetical protein
MKVEGVGRSMKEVHDPASQCAYIILMFRGQHIPSRVCMLLWIGFVDIHQC